MNIAERAALGGDKPVLVFSMEMPADSLILRMLSSLGRIDQSKIRSGNLSDDDWPRLTSAVTLLNDKPLFFDDTAALSPNAGNDAMLNCAGKSVDYVLVER